MNISFIESFEKSIKEAESDIANKTERLAADNEKLSLIPCERDKMLNSANAAVNADVAECDALYARRSQAHAAKRQQEQREPNRKARRRGA